MVVRAGALLAITMLGSAAPLRAQDSGAWQVGFDMLQSASGSRPGNVFSGQMRGVREQAVALRLSTSLARLGAVRLRYTAQVVPYQAMRGVERYTAFANGDTVTAYILQGYTTARGAGVVPLGLDLGVALGPRVLVSAGAGVGIAAFTQHVPVAGSRQRAFTAEWGTRLQLDLRRGRSLDIGYRWKHTSNGLTAYENPGVDSRLVTLGVGWTVRVPR